jgi:hypothetical protein
MTEIYNAALADQQRGLISKRTGQIITPFDYFTQSDINKLLGANNGESEVAPKEPNTDEDLLKKYGG